MADQIAIAAVGDDAVRPFHVEALDIRGRAIQLGPSLDTILNRHNYPKDVSKLLGEAIVLGVLLGSSLKFEGQFILQTETDGPVRRLIVDYRTPGDIRAFASFDADALAALENAPSAELLGNGTLAMTVDQGTDMSRYQGIVRLEGGTLEDVAHAYFQQSEQIPTRIRLAVAELMVREGSELRRQWRAGGLLAQFLPQSVPKRAHRDLPGGDMPASLSLDPLPFIDDGWTETLSLIATVEDHELVDSDVPVDRLLYRLFHEHGVRVFDPQAVADNCSCSRGRVEGLLRSFTAEDIARSVEDGHIDVKCEFCGSKYQFDPAELQSSPADESSSD